MIIKTLPENFNPKFEVVSCFVKHGNTFLMTQYQDHKKSLWGVPAGKKEENEDLHDAIVRELFEETGLSLEKQDFIYFDKVYVDHYGYQFIYHMFEVDFSEKPKITLSESEHQDYKWATPKEALTHDLIEDEDECIKMFYKLRNKKKE